MRPTAKSLILDLLSTLRRDALPVRALVSAGSLFDLTGNGIRVALARLLQAGLVERDERGLYRLAGAAEAINRETTSWRTRSLGIRSWQGGWIAVLVPPSVVASARVLARRRRALAFLGMRELQPGLYLRPDNLPGGIPAARERLAELGLDPGCGVAALDDLDGATETRARDLWDVGDIRAGYRRTTATLDASRERLPHLPREEAMVESFLLGGSGIRQVVFDPLLPEEMVPAAERLALTEAMRRYDRAGRQCWSSFMREFGASDLRTPARLGIVDGEGRLAIPGEHAPEMT